MTTPTTMFPTTPTTTFPTSPTTTESRRHELHDEVTS